MLIQAVRMIYRNTQIKLYFVHSLFMRIFFLADAVLFYFFLMLEMDTSECWASTHLRPPCLFFLPEHNPKGKTIRGLFTQKIAHKNVLVGKYVHVGCACLHVCRCTCVCGCANMRAWVYVEARKQPCNTIYLLFLRQHLSLDPGLTK